MNVGGVFMLAFIGSLAQSAAVAGSVRDPYSQLFSLITWTSVAFLRRRSSRRPESRCRSTGAREPASARRSAHRPSWRSVHRFFFSSFPRAASRGLRMRIQKSWRSQCNS